jgi:hypothetical protein
MHPSLYSCSLEFDLHALVLNVLAKVLSDDLHTSTEEVTRLVERCPPIPNDNSDGANELVRN